MSEREICPDFDIGISEGGNQDLHLTRSHPPGQKLSAVGGLSGGGASGSQPSNPRLSDCESRAQAKRNPLKNSR